MKRRSDFFKRICAEENLREAFKKASRGKRNRRIVRKIEADLDNKIAELRELLVEGKFHTAEYKTKEIFEPKKRTIHILPFWPDRVVQHAIINVLEPFWANTFIYDSYACMKGKGQHAGSARTLRWVKAYKYVCKCDIRRFYPTIDHEILKHIVRKKIKDEQLLLLLDDIIDSTEGVGIPIGNLLSQWFGNLYLNEFDHYVKEELRIKAYVRYCDDFVFFSDSKEELWGWLNKIEKYLAENLLLRFSKKDVFSVKQGIDFLGYRHFPKGYMLLRKSTAKRMRRLARDVQVGMQKNTMPPETVRGKLASISGWASWANSYNFTSSIELGNLTEEMTKYVEFCRAKETVKCR